VIDRLIVHQFDPFSPRAGGVDTCISDMVAFAPEDTRLAIVGMTAESGVRLGKWMQISHRGRDLQFMSVARFGAGPRRRVPHSALLALGLARWRPDFPPAPVQVHRLDVAVALAKSNRMQHGYIQFIHNPHGRDQGVVGKGSDSFWRHAPWVYRRLESTLAAADRVVVFSGAEARRLQEAGFAALPWQTWFDPQVFFPLPRTRRSGHLRLVVVGRLERQKDPLLALDVVAELDRRAVPLECTFVGDGSMRAAMEARVDDLGIAHKVAFVGLKPRPEVASAMRDADVLLLTSHYEGSPRVVIEALATGTPVATAPEADTDCLIESGRTGCRADTRRVDDLAHAVIAARDTPSESCFTAVSGLRADVAIPRLFAVTESQRTNACDEDRDEA
jgi:glycosyltransferase involved in cell wall biosynthesis